ncbi:hypothetical protein ACFE04_028399 [Oxalis oulophora]
MSNPSAAGGGGGGGSSSSSKFKAGASQSSKVGASQSSETFSFKRKRGMFQKDCELKVCILSKAFDHPVDYGAQSHTQRVSFSAYAMVGFVPRTHSVGESSGMGLVHTLTIGFISMETQLWWRTYIVPYRYGN